ncbi:hypothetical protein ACHAXA_010654 [Cyclostephanos tholiformis]|uniref:Methyltransferase type 11 domain-containing protein n=1 Tax=Cyclostephanos tholiformis TaxID=382380 RepID=A0ABD3RSS3_9STRA
MKRKGNAGAAIRPGEGVDETDDRNLKDLLLNNKRRQRGEEDVTGGIANDDTPSPRSSGTSEECPAPKYGSREYWDARYKSHVSDAQSANDAASGVDGDGCVMDGVWISKEAMKPGHEWYFSYDELRPLIMPLIFGGDEGSVGDHDDDEDAESWVEEEGDDGDDGEGTDEDDGDDDSIIAEDESGETGVTLQSRCEEKSDNTNKAMDGACDTAHMPKRVLEVGCGDRPLGMSLASDLISMHAGMGTDARLLVEEITCIDYSDIVVRKLNGQRLDGHVCNPSNDESTLKTTDKLQPIFRTIDARSLPFLSNTYDLVLEKGTLDAMLSDEEEGLSNCIKIVKEMARVTSDGGAIFIVSHLNANEAKGMSWLEDVVFNGLKEEFLMRRQWNRNGEASQVISLDENAKAKAPRNDNDYNEDDKEYIWSVEVHGGGGQHLDANGEEIDDTNEDAVYGPAVYIVKKKSVPAAIAKELFGKKKGRLAKEGVGENEEEVELAEMPPVKLTFMTYDDD